MQDNATGSFPKQEPHVVVTAQSAPLRKAVRALLLGAQVWVLACGWPLMEGAREGANAEWALAGVALLALIAGAMPPSERLSARLGSLAPLVRPGLLLCVFPVALTATYALRPSASNEERYGLLGHLWLCVALGAYAASASALCSPAAARGTCEVAPISISVETGGWRARLSLRGFAMICVCGAAMLALVAPFDGAPLAPEPSWGASDPSGGVLAAIVGGALGVATLALFLPQALRARRVLPSATRGAIGRRALFFALLALVGLATFAVVDGF